jgi:hypothetical protein
MCVCPAACIGGCDSVPQELSNTVHVIAVLAGRF